MLRSSSTWCTAALILLGVSLHSVSAQDYDSSAHSVRNDLPRPYETERDWGELPPGTAAWAAVVAISSGR